MLDEWSLQKLEGSKQDSNEREEKKKGACSIFPVFSVPSRYAPP